MWGGGRNQSLEDGKGDGCGRLAVSVPKVSLDPSDDTLHDWGFNSIKGEVRVNMDGLDVPQVGVGCGCKYAF